MIRRGILLLLMAACATSQMHSAEKRSAGSDQEKLIGAWHLVSITGADGKPITNGLPTGMLIYTRDGHMSVQLMYPKSAKSLTNEYVQNGYEASFGSYDVNGSAHTLTHHVLGSNTGDRLVGRDLPRIYRFNAGGQLVLRSADASEHWSVTWEHY